MRAARSLVVVLSVVCAALVPLVTVAAQDGLALHLDDTGMLAVHDAEGKICDIEVNCHGPEWTYASQRDAKTERDTSTATEKVFIGGIPVPGTTGGTLDFEERIRARDDSVGVEYLLNFSGPMTVHGLQVSILLPADRFAGKRIRLQTGEAGGRYILLPTALNAANWVIGTFEAKSVGLGADADRGFTVTVDEAKIDGLLVHDLRQWDRDEFEVRLPLLTENEGRIVGNTDRFPVALTLSPKAEIKGP